MPGAKCWACHGWGVLDKRDTGVRSWSGETGGEHGERFTVYSLHMAPGVFEGELIDCPFCDGKGGR